MRIVLVVFLALSLSCQKTPTTPSSVKIVDSSLRETKVLEDGPFSVSESEYSSEPKIDREILPAGLVGDSMLVALRGRVYLPEGDGPFPFAVFLHGNHATCGYLTGDGNPRLDITNNFTMAGACWFGAVEVPSHRGYEASARQLASWGIAVISINSNRGINGTISKDNSPDPGLVKARGVLVLRQLEEFSRLNRGETSAISLGDGLDLKGRLDFSRVGFMGHSRGGEGVRQAYSLHHDAIETPMWKNRIPGLTVRGIFEVAPVDIGTENGKKVEPRGTAWTLLLAGCDNDVYDFAGSRVYNRLNAMPHDGFDRAIVTLWGANHNFFNSEWQVSDANHRCHGDQTPLWDVNAPPLQHNFAGYDPLARQGLTGSKTQIAVEKGLLFAFFMANLGDKSDLSRVFDPQYHLPTELSALADMSRNFRSAADSLAVFDPETVIPVASAGLKVQNTDDYLKGLIDDFSNQLNQASMNSQAALSAGNPIQKAIMIESKGGETEQSVYLPFTGAQTIQDYWTLDLALAVRKSCDSYQSELFNYCTPIRLDSDFTLRLRFADGTESQAVAIKDYVALKNWQDRILLKVGSTYEKDNLKYHSYEFIPLLYQLSRIELDDFNPGGKDVAGVSFYFKAGDATALAVESIRMTKRPNP